MVACKLCDLLDCIDKRVKIDFRVNSLDKLAHFEGAVFDFLKSYLYQVFASDFVCDIKVKGGFVDKVLYIVVNTHTE